MKTSTLVVSWRYILFAHLSSLSLYILQTAFHGDQQQQERCCHQDGGGALLIHKQLDIEYEQDEILLIVSQSSWTFNHRRCCATLCFPTKLHPKQKCRQ